MTIIEYLKNYLPEQLYIDDDYLEELKEEIEEQESNDIDFMLYIEVGSITVESNLIKVKNVNNINLNEVKQAIIKSFIEPIEKETAFGWDDLYDMEVGLETVKDAVDILNDL